MHSFTREQIVQTGIDELWEFISSPRNLNQVTPDWLDFRLEGDLPDEMYNGLIVQYKIKIPILGYQTWVTELKHIEKGKRFIDEQRHGPYKIWYHQHILESIEPNKTKMIDIVHYDVGWGILGKLVNALYVRKNIENIFDYRIQAFERIFQKSLNTEG